MGTVLASKIAADAASQLFDTGYDRFTQTVHLGFINDGQIQAAILKPDISVTNLATQMAEGTKQTVAGISLIKLVRNMGTTGLVPGNVIYLGDMLKIDRIMPTWHTATASAVIEQYFFDPRDPKHFYIYPPQPAADQGYAEQIEAIKPTAIATIGTAITIDDVYESALFHYDMYRACSIDAKHSTLAGQKALYHYGLFTQLITGKEITETTVEP